MRSLARRQERQHAQTGLGGLTLLGLALALVQPDTLGIAVLKDV